MADTPTSPNTLRRARMRQPHADVPSPCVSVCHMDVATGLCQGCWRTLDEIAHWGVLDASEKLGIWQHIEQRQAQPSAPQA